VDEGRCLPPSSVSFAVLGWAGLRIDEDPIPASRHYRRRARHQPGRRDPERSELSSSAEFLQTDLMDRRRWLRVVGDTIFAIGCFAFVLFVFRLSNGYSYRPETSDERDDVPGRQPTYAPTKG
jgi:hypothetical protein